MSIIYFDTETTGFKEKDRVIEVGAFIYNNDHSKINIVNELCNKDVVEEIPFDAMEVHGITMEHLQSKGLSTYHDTSFAKHLNKINEEEGEKAYLVAHNIKFDINMLAKEGFESKMTPIDTLRVAKHLYKDIPHRLQYLRYALNLTPLIAQYEHMYGLQASAHSALGDVLVLRALVKHFEEKEGLSFAEMAQYTQTPVMLTKMPFGKHKGVHFVDIDMSYIRWLYENGTDLDEDLEYTLKSLIQNAK